MTTGHLLRKPTRRQRRQGITESTLSKVTVLTLLNRDRMLVRHADGHQHTCRQDQLVKDEGLVDFYFANRLPIPHNIT